MAVCSDLLPLFIRKQVLRSYCPVGLTAIHLFLKRTGLMAVCSDLLPLFTPKQVLRSYCPVGLTAITFRHG